MHAQTERQRGVVPMRRLVLAGIAGLLVSTNVGCLLPAYSGDPTRRTQQLINTSEDLRKFLDEWERLWHLDQPSHLTPHRVHGGLL